MPRKSRRALLASCGDRCTRLIVQDGGGNQATRKHFPEREHRPRQRTEGHLCRHGHRHLGSD